MKLKTNKLLTLTLASSLVAITAGCGGSKAAAPKTTPVVVPDPDPVAYSAWEDAITIATVVTDNAFLAGTAAVAAVGQTAAVDANLTGLPTGETATTLNLASQVAAQVGTGNAITRTEETLGGEAADGVGFATTGTGDDARYFAGVIAGADVGVPVVTTGTATWSNGLFQAVGANAVASKTFALTVNFADSEISAIVPVGTDTFATGATSYYISGSYNAAGVITGNVLYRGFASATANTAPLVLAAAGTALTAAIAADAEDTDTVGLGTLSGLIGVDGVLGAFYSSGSDGDGATGFAGGFVVSSADNAGGDDPDVVYADWAAGATQVAVITDNAFLAGTATGLTGAPGSATVETLNLAEGIADAVPVSHGDSTNTAGTAGRTAETLGGSALNGVAFFTTGATTEARYFAGLHNTTDLGAPISATPTAAIWNGLFQAVGAGDYVTAAKEFALTVTYSATADSTIIGLVGANDNTNAHGTADDTSYYISGTYNADGVITGNILYGDFSAATDDAGARTAAGTALTAALVDGAASPATDGLGVLSGLIGANGAVGAFYSNAEDATAGYAGGFVVSMAANAGGATIDANAFVPPVVYANWLPTAPAALTAAATTRATAPTGNAFVHGVAAGLSLPDAVTTTPLGLDEGTLTGAATNGVAFGMNGDTTAARFYAGILSGTTLGAPVTSSATGAWVGSFEAVGGTAYATATRSITINVDFGDLEIDAHVPAGTATDTFTAASTNSYYLEGSFVAATGLVTGTIIHGDYSAATSATAATVLAKAAFDDTTGVTDGRGTVTGLIGATGLVGAFISTATGATAGYAGGFVAAPPASGS